MKGRLASARSPVYRVTVDSREGEGLARLLVAQRLRPGEFKPEDTKGWSVETEESSTPQDFLSRMRIKSTSSILAKAAKSVQRAAPAGKRPERTIWLGLTEGRVFLTGWFRVVGGRKAPKMIVPSNHQEFLRIDDLASVDARGREYYRNAIGRKERLNA